MTPKPTALALAWMALAGVLKERVFGDPHRALIQGWENVFKYYRHYRATGDLPKIDGLEKLLKLEQKKTLERKAGDIQSRHPGLFDRIDLNLLE